MINSNLEQTDWNCLYHIAFAPAFRSQALYGRIRDDIVEIFGALCRQRDFELLKSECCPDYVYLLLSIPPKSSVSTVVGYLKGKSALMIFDQFEHASSNCSCRHFWCKGFYVDTQERSREAIDEFIRNQLGEDKAGE